MQLRSLVESRLIRLSSHRNRCGAASGHESSAGTGGTAVPAGMGELNRRGHYEWPRPSPMGPCPNSPEEREDVRSKKLELHRTTRRTFIADGTPLLGDDHGALLACSSTHQRSTDPVYSPFKQHIRSPKVTSELPRRRSIAVLSPLLTSPAWQHGARYRLDPVLEFLVTYKARILRAQRLVDDRSPPASPDLFQRRR